MKSAIKESVMIALNQGKEFSEDIKKDLDAFLDEIQPDVEVATKTLMATPTSTNINTLKLLGDSVVLHATRSTCREINEAKDVLAAIAITAVRVAFTAVRGA